MGDNELFESLGQLLKPASQLNGLAQNINK